MSSEVIACPACAHPARVPESLFGQPVRCPKCKAYFTAPTRDAEGNLGVGVLLPDPPPRPAAIEASLSPYATTSILVPAMFLLLIGVISTTISGFELYRALFDPAAASESALSRAKQSAQFANVEFNEQSTRQFIDSYLMTILYSAFQASLVTLLGAAMMLFRLNWWLAVFGSLIAICNFSNGMCCFGAPVGIFCFIKLYDPQVQQMFRRLNYYPDDNIANQSKPACALVEQVRGQRITAARVIFIIVGIMVLLQILIEFSTAETRIRRGFDQEIARQGTTRENLAPDARTAVEEIEAKALRIVNLYCMIFLGVGIAFIVFGVIIHLYPVPITTIGLVLYLVCEVTGAVIAPATILHGIVIKVILVIALVKAVQAAIAYEKERKRLRLEPSAPDTP